MIDRRLIMFWSWLTFLSISLVSGEFLIDQRYRDKNRIDPPPDPFFKTLYDKSYNMQGAQKPIYNVMFGYFFYFVYQKRKKNLIRVLCDWLI